MKNDYVVKRIFIGVAIGVILMLIRGCDVKAQTYNPSLTNCSLYYATNSKDTGTLGTTTLNNLQYRTCTSSTSRSFTSVSFNYQSTGISSGNYILQFLIKKTSSRINTPSVMVLSGSNTSGVYTTNTCFTSASDGNTYDYQITQNGSIYHGTNDLEYYSVYCPNVSFMGGWFQVYIQSSFSGADNSVTSLFSIGRDFNFTLIEDVSSAINNQSQQQHQDNQAINDNLTDVNDNLNDLNDSINDTSQDISSNFNSNTSTGFWNNYGSTGVTELWAMPINIFSRVRNRLLYADANVQLTIDETDLPMSNKINYGGDFVLPPLRNFINNIIGSNWYEFIGTLLGGILLVKVLISKGRGALKLWTLRDTQNEIWGGIE